MMDHHVNDGDGTCESTRRLAAGVGFGPTVKHATKTTPVTSLACDRISSKVGRLFNEERTDLIPFQFSLVCLFAFRSPRLDAHSLTLLFTVLR